MMIESKGIDVTHLVTMMELSDKIAPRLFLSGMWGNSEDENNVSYFLHMNQEFHRLMLGIYVDGKETPHRLMSVENDGTIGISVALLNKDHADHIFPLSSRRS